MDDIKEEKKSIKILYISKCNRKDIDDERPEKKRRKINHI